MANEAARTTFRGIMEEVGVADTINRVSARKNASVLYAPRRKQISPKRLYQVTVNGVATTGAGFSTEAWRTKADAELAAKRKRGLISATWVNGGPVVKVEATTESVDTVKEWANIDLCLYRQYRRNSTGYTYTGVSQ